MISLEFELQQPIVRQIVYKWRKFTTTVGLPSSGCRQPKASLALANVHIHESEQQ